MRTSVSDWREIYKSRLVPASEAVKVIKSGDRVVMSNNYAEPQHLVEALANRASELRDVKLLQGGVLGKAQFARPEYDGHLRMEAAFAGTNSRKAFAEHRADFYPTLYSDMPRWVTGGNLKVDAVFVLCTPPDEDGYCSYGINVDYEKAMIDLLPVVKIAQVNKNMPWTYPSKFHVSQVQYFVEYDEPLNSFPPPEIGPVEQGIGNAIAELVPDEATLQLGVGSIPDAVLLTLKHKKDLGIHSEMFSDGVIDLVEAGVITGAKKTIHPGKLTATFVMGSNRLYQFIDHNPSVEMLPVDYVNDPFVIGQYDNFISINSALQVDLMGQVNAEMIGPNQYSGVGGQVDFVRGAARSKGGKSIIALPSTAARGKASRILPELDRGSAVTTSRNEVQYVATEYGIAELRGNSLSQRARALIAIAHPDFREQLSYEAKQRGLI